MGKCDVVKWVKNKEKKNRKGNWRARSWLAEQGRRKLD